ncbi:transcription factor MYB34 [Gossypium australe]|uniref:Transcription factor MYB34 n=1 Tax=Gossypium australe TaxID=47621 RepID=A0A5B6VWL2_9ROSI|nr:transcription factor MYB34 [Gossypium australe]
MDLGNQNDDQGNGATNVHNPILIADDRDRAIRQYVVPFFNELNMGIRRPKIEASQFELKPVMFQMLQTMGQFSGMPTEDPHIHLRLFMEVSDSFKITGVTTNDFNLVAAQPPRPQFNFYNPSWLTHPNFSWNNQGNGLNNTYMQHRPIPKPPQAESSHSLETFLKAYMTKNDALIQSQATTLKNLENQMGALSSDIENRRNLSKEHCETLDPKEAVAEYEPIEKEESQPTIEIPAPEEPEVTKSDR